MENLFRIFAFSLAFLQFSFLSLSLTNTTLTDQEALLSFKASLLSPSSIGTLSSWNQSSSSCQWRGVLCDNSSRVTSLDLRGLGLTGPVSPHLGNLSSLRLLYLQENYFAGALPGELGGLTRLEVLNVSSNLIGGGIPANISSCTELTALDLSVNSIFGEIPAEVGLLKKLQILQLNQNQLTGSIPPSLKNLSRLRTLNLGTNTLTGTIPRELAQLRNLKTLQLSINNLTGTVPPSLYDSSSLVTFDLASNDLHGEIPDDIGFRLPNLLTFHFCINKFTGGYPSSLHNLTKLQSLWLSHNLLHGTIPPGLESLHDLVLYNIGFNNFVSEDLNLITSLTNSSKLEFLAINGNLLEGVIPESVGNLSTSLSNFYLGENRISGKIPASIAALKNLTLLNMNQNSISGEIPPELGQLKQLIRLVLSDNNLSGRIPPSLGELSLLTELDLNGNKLEGAIPNTFGGLQSLLSLDLSSNRLNGSLPGELFTLSSLTSLLNLSKNALAGPMPDEIGNLENLVTIDLSSNLFSGNISKSIQNCKSLEHLSISNNSFSGHIPDSIGNLKGLMSLDLSSNHLSGSIPLSFENLQALQSLNLSFNNLQGGVPAGGIFRNLSHVHLEGNPRLCVSKSSCGDTSKHRSSKTSLVAVAAVLLPALVLVLLVLFIGRRKKGAAKDQAKIDPLAGQHPMVSYEELASATENFDARNLIGAGSFGSVYKGVLIDGTAVAVKVLNLAVAGALKSLLAECAALRNVRHRNLIKLVTLCLSIDFANNDFRALVYELVPNGSLEEWIRGRRRHQDGGGLSTRERLAVALDIAGALDYLHNDCDIKVVHCDLKPSNVMLAENMTAKLGDFGLAKLVGHDQSHNSISITGGLKGSIGYIPPEYGFGGKPSRKGDIYSYGVMLLELVTGKSPTDEMFAGDESLEKWVRDAFPERAMEVLEAELLPTGSAAAHGDGISAREEWSQVDCLVSMVEIALSCVNRSPEARPDIREVLHELSSTADRSLTSSEERKRSSR